ncbi:MAG: hypothetical protein U1F60_08985 [Planctomycetota bacterium]
MLHRSLTLALLVAPVIAQSNAVPGLDILMYDLTDLSYTGRRGAAFPNGEAGFMMGHSWCNTGTANLPWTSQSGGLMVDQYPRIAFLLARESAGRMVQISGRSFCKYSPTAYNFQTGPCLPCNTGAGSFFFVGCSDTYGSGINENQANLGPSEELNPWLGTWSLVGSYFDKGDPAAVGAAATDSVKSLTFSQISAFDAVKNRITVRENEIIAGANYYGQVQAVVQGEPGTNRGNNIANRQLTINTSGTSFTTGSAGASVAGSVLTRWQGAMVGTGDNGSGDGHFVVGAKATGPNSGMWHYEYAIHNVDNHRGGGTIHIPLASGAVVQNLGFRDLDLDGSNNWSFTVGANEITVTLNGTNSIDWNTIYNVWFDCSIQPGAGSMVIDQARPGTGGPSVAVSTQVPSGMPFAAKYTVGTSCGTCTGTAYELFGTSRPIDLAGKSLTMTLANGAYALSSAPVAFVPAAGTNLNLGLTGQANVALPFSLPYPGGTTTNLQVVASGYISPALPNAVQILPSVPALLTGKPRWAVMWSFMNPSGANNVYVDSNPSRVIVTWNNVPLLSGPGNHTFQAQFYPDGTVHYVWPTLASSTFAHMTGWSPAGGFADPGQTDVSTLVSKQLCPNPFDGLQLNTQDQPVLGTTVDLDLTGVPGGTLMNGMGLGLQQQTPPDDLSGNGMPGCFSHVFDPQIVLLPVNGSSLTVPLTIPNTQSLAGQIVVVQGLSYNPPLNAYGVVVSNAVVMSLGL